MIHQLNTKRLEPKKGKPYAEMIWFGDLHLGSKFCNEEKAKEMIDYCFQNNIYVFCMGDMIESNNRYSVGAGVYEQKLSPQEQIEEVIALLKPLGDKGLIVGYLQGNHEQRMSQEVGIDVSKWIAKEINSPYLGFAGWNLFYVGKQSYTMYAWHGATSAKFKHTKLKSVIDMSSYFWADLIAMGHTHDLLTESVERHRISRSKKMIECYKSHIVITGHYYDYGGYVKMKGLPPSKLGSPKVKLFSEKFDIHISV